MKTTPEVKEIVEEFDKKFAQYFYPKDRKDTMTWLRKTLTTLTAKHQEELKKAYNKGVQDELNRESQNMDNVIAGMVKKAVEAEREMIKLLAHSKTVWADECMNILVIPKNAFIEALTPTKTDKTTEV